jgi:hypothetical protein
MDVTIDITELKKNHEKVYEQLYNNKLDNLVEACMFLYVYHLPRVNQEEIENLSGKITKRTFESVIRKYSMKEKARITCLDS